MANQIPVSFDIQITDKLVPYELNPNMSKTRVSVFRKYGNANGSYFTDEVANRMVEELPGSPIIGRFVAEDKDFSSHLTINDTRAYGFVPPENAHFAWEKRTEADGKEYEYACFDAVLWTSRYDEAKIIPSKGQSMELNPRTITGDWREVDGETYYVYDSCSVYGLCVLGDNVRPCFDEACFYEAQDGKNNIETILSHMKEEIQNNFSQLVAENKGGIEEMGYKVNLPQDNKIQALFDAVNKNVDENGERIVDYALINVTDDHVEFGSIIGGNYKSVNYSLDENAVVLGEEAEMNVVLFNEEDKEAFDAFAAIGGENHSVVSALAKYNEISAANEQLTADLAAANTKIDEFTASDYPSQIQALNNKIASYETRIAEYEAKENEAIAAQKESVIDEYSELVDADVLEEVKENKDAFSLEQIESKLAINFARKNKPSHHRVPSLEEDNSNPTLRILNEYKKKKGE
nr:MAG TPA: hypothetical protein [Caudoviricetes sp.]